MYFGIKTLILAPPVWEVYIFHKIKGRKKQKFVEKCNYFATYSKIFFFLALLFNVKISVGLIIFTSWKIKKE